MHARDAAGRQVSLLNDDAPAFAPRHFSYESPTNTPELLRSDSYDSNMSNGPASPITPNVDYYSRQQLYSLPQEYPMEAAKPIAYAESARSASYDDDMANQVPNDRPAKRYPCRYRDSHGCEKTFTTSGHASRHSKIHTAEKAVQCTFAGCQKKFTRADNMKQHLETHYKDKSRSSSQRSHKSSLSESRRKPSSRSSRDTPDHYSMARTSVHSPNAHGGAHMHGLNLPIHNRPGASRTPSGLDALAMAVACQEGTTA